MRIAGIDPGYHRCGWAVLEIANGGGMLHGSGTIVAEAGQEMAQRLHLIAEGIDQLISLWQPDVMAVEELFFVKNVKTGQERVINAHGVFIAIGHVPSTELFKGQLKMKSSGYLLVKPGTASTDVPGVFAAGDVTDDIYRQAVTAAGMGCMAALEAEKYLQELEAEDAKAAE